MSAEIRPIGIEDLPAVSRFLHRMDPNRSPEAWQAALMPGWPRTGDDFGQMLVMDGEVRGAICQLRSRRRYGGVPRHSCNFTSWYVDLEHGKGLGVRLLQAAFSDSDAIYSTHSPEARTIKVFLRMGFQSIDTTEWIVANLPIGRRSESVYGEDIARRLEGDALENFNAHSAMPTVGHVGLAGPGNTFCHVAFVRSRWHKVPVARIIYASDYDMLAQLLPAFSRIALARFGLPLTAVEKRRCARRPALAIGERWKEPILFRGAGVRPEQIDALYTEVVTFAPRLR